MKNTFLFLTTSVLLWAGLQFAFGAPTYLEGNPTCVSLWYAYGAKVDPPVTGTYSLGWGTFTWDKSLAGLITWSSTVWIDAVIVKWWPVANLYTYAPESMWDNGLTTPTNPNNGNPYGLSHLEICYDYNIQITKTANPFFTREFLWSIDKQADTTWLTLSIGQIGSIQYIVSANATWYLDKDRWVTGTISIYNPDAINTGTVTSIQEQLSGAIVSCPGSAPYSIAPHWTLTCTYTASLPNANSGTNIVYVNTTGKVEGSSGSATIVFGGPTSILDQQASIMDSRVGFLGTWVAGTPFSSGYSWMIGPYTWAGAYTFVNTGTLTTLDTHTILNDPVVVPIVVTAVNYGCVYSQWYWKTHSLYWPANKSGSGRAVGSGENAIFFLSNQTRYQVLNQAPKWGNVYYILAHQYIAAELNRLSWASVPSEVQTALTWAKNFFLSKTPTSAFTNTEKTQATSYASLLDQYNNGLIGPMHCGDDDKSSGMDEVIPITSISINNQSGNANNGVGNPVHNDNDKAPKGLVNNANANPKAIIAATKHDK